MARFKIPPPDEAKAFEELSIIIDELKRYALVFAICASDAAADEHIARYQAQHPELQISTLDVQWPDARIYTRLRELYDTQHPDVIMVTGMAAWTERGEDAKGNEFTAALNFARDGLHEYVRCPVVFWCTPEVYNFIQRNAHDFYSVATSTLRVSIPERHQPQELVLDFQAAHSLSHIERQARIKELEILVSLENKLSVSNIDSFFALGLLLLVDGQYSYAIQILERTRQFFRSIWRECPLDYTALLQALAQAHLSLSHYFEARALYEDAISVLEVTVGHNDPRMAVALGSLAGIEADKGNFDIAKKLYEDALAIEEVTVGRYHPDTATIIHELATIEFKTGDCDTALLLYEQALSIKERTLGWGHASTAVTLNSLAILHEKLGHLDLAKALYEQALSIEEATFGQQHPETAKTLFNLATLALQTGNLRVAQALAGQAQGIYKAAMGENHPRTRRAYALLSQIYAAQGDKAAAAEMTARANRADENEEKSTELLNPVTQ